MFRFVGSSPWFSLFFERVTTLLTSCLLFSVMQSLTKELLLVWWKEFSTEGKKNLTPDDTGSNENGNVAYFEGVPICLFNELCYETRSDTS